MATNPIDSAGDVLCKYECVNIWGVPTRLMKINRSDDPRSSTTKSDEELDLMCVVIPGNPGVIDFYEEFMIALFKESGCRVPVWGVSHAGHTTPPGHAGNAAVYDLHDQVQHKAAFLQDFVPAGKNIVLIGHSIGCHIILELMKHHSSIAVLKSVLLFPTIERMWESPNGTYLAPLLCYARWGAVILVYLGSYLAEGVKQWLINLFFRGRKVPECAIKASLHLFNPSCAKNSLTMAAHEMLEVKEPDLDTISRYLPKLLFYYGARDGWCPVEYCHSMRERFPKGDIRLCERMIAHAFCLESSSLMANLVWSWLQPEIIAKQKHS